MGYKELRDNLKVTSEQVLAPIIVLLNKWHLTPNFVTWLGFLINVIGCVFVYKGAFLAGGLIIIFASVFDMLDGALARKMNLKTKFGGFLDSVTDRLSEGALYLALLMLYLETGDNVGVILCYIVVLTSFLVSYIRARAGGLKIDCSGGIFTRPERMIVIVIGLFFNLTIPALWVIAVLSTVTVVQRFLLVNEQAKHIN